MFAKLKLNVKNYEYWIPDENQVTQTRTLAVIYIVNENEIHFAKFAPFGWANSTTWRRSPKNLLDIAAQNLLGMYRQMHPFLKGYAVVNCNRSQLNTFTTFVSQKKKVDTRLIVHIQQRLLGERYRGTEAKFFIDASNSRNINPYLEVSLTKTLRNFKSPVCLVCDSVFGLSIKQILQEFDYYNEQDVIIDNFGFFGIRAPEDMPNDFFSCCMTTPVKALIAYFYQHWFKLPLPDSGNLTDSYYPESFCFLDFLPGYIEKRNTPLGALHWTIQGILGQIALERFDSKLYKKCFRQDVSVAILFRNYMVAQKLYKMLYCEVSSLPDIPDVTDHKLWEYIFDLIQMFIYRYSTECTDKIKHLIQSSTELVAGEINFAEMNRELLTYKPIDHWDYEKFKKPKYFNQIFERTCLPMYYFDTQTKDLFCLVHLIKSPDKRSDSLKHMCRLFDIPCKNEMIIKNILLLGIFIYLPKILASEDDQIQTYLLHLSSALISFNIAHHNILLRDKSHIGYEFFLNFLKEGKIFNSFEHIRELIGELLNYDEMSTPSEPDYRRIKEKFEELSYLTNNLLNVLNDYYNCFFCVIEFYRTASRSIDMHEIPKLKRQPKQGLQIPAKQLFEENEKLRKETEHNMSEYKKITTELYKAGTNLLYKVFEPLWNYIEQRVARVVHTVYNTEIRLFLKRFVNHFKLNLNRTKTEGLLMLYVLLRRYKMLREYCSSFQVSYNVEYILSDLMAQHNSNKNIRLLTSSFLLIDADIRANNMEDLVEIESVDKSPDMYINGGIDFEYSSDEKSEFLKIEYLFTALEKELVPKNRQALLKTILYLFSNGRLGKSFSTLLENFSITDNKEYESFHFIPLERKMICLEYFKILIISAQSKLYCNCADIAKYSLFYFHSKSNILCSFNDYSCFNYPNLQLTSEEMLKYQARVNQFLQHEEYCKDFIESFMNKRRKNLLRGNTDFVYKEWALIPKFTCPVGFLKQRDEHESNDNLRTIYYKLDTKSFYKHEMEYILNNYSNFNVLITAEKILVYDYSEEYLAFSLKLLRIPEIFHFTNKFKPYILYSSTFIKMYLLLMFEAVAVGFRILREQKVQEQLSFTLLLRDLVNFKDGELILLTSWRLFKKIDDFVWYNLKTAQKASLTEADCPEFVEYLNLALEKGEIIVEKLEQVKDVIKGTRTFFCKFSCTLFIFSPRQRRYSN